MLIRKYRESDIKDMLNIWNDTERFQNERRPLRKYLSLLPGTVNWSPAYKEF